MRVLFVHQNFPGQFGNLASALASTGNEVVALEIDTPAQTISGVRHLLRQPKPPARRAHRMFFGSEVPNIQERMTVNLPKNRFQIALAAMSVLVALTSPIAALATKSVPELAVDFYSINEAPLSTESHTGYWLDNNQFICMLLPEGTKDEGPVRRTNVVVVNYSEKRSKIIAQDSALLSFDEETHNANIGRWGAYTGDWDRRSPVEQIRILPDGSISKIGRFAPGEKLPSVLPEHPAGVTVRSFVRRNDGYLLPDSATAEEQQNRPREDFSPLAVWIRPNTAPLRLSVRFDEVESAIEYFPFLNKYLLNGFDSQRSSRTSSHLNKSWHRPYEFTPYRFLNRDGTIEEIPYPQAIREYGLNFSSFVPTRRGFIINARNLEGAGLYLLDGDRLLRLIARTKTLGISFETLFAEGADVFRVSPDGCRVAFQHYKEKAANAKAYTPKFLSIIDICKVQSS